jgi:hypothetical protein
MIRKVARVQRGLRPNPVPDRVTNGNQSTKSNRSAGLFLSFALRYLTFAVFWSTLPILQAQSGGGYDLTWSTVDGGGQESTGGEFVLRGTVGQADAHEPMTDAGGVYELSGGFWVSCGGCRLFGDLVYPYCADDPVGQPDVDDLTRVVQGFADWSAYPEADLVRPSPPLNSPCDHVLCANDADCQAFFLGDEVPCIGGRCVVVDVDDLSAVVAAFGGTFQCPHPCPP